MGRYRYNIYLEHGFVLQLTLRSDKQYEHCESCELYFILLFSFHSHILNVINYYMHSHLFLCDRNISFHYYLFKLCLFSSRFKRLPLIYRSSKEQ